MMSNDADARRWILRSNRGVHLPDYALAETVIRRHINDIRAGGGGYTATFLDKMISHAGIQPTAKLMKSLIDSKIAAEMSTSSAELFQHLGLLEIADEFIKDAIADTLDIRNRVARSWFFRKRRLRQVDEHLARLVAWRLRLNK